MLPDTYGCVVANRFGDLLDDDADPFDLINQAETEKEKKKKKKKEEDEKKAKLKRPGQRESQKERRAPIALDRQDPVPVRKQQQARPAPVAESRDGEEAQWGMKRAAAAGQRRANQDKHPQDFSISKPFDNIDSDLKGRGGFRGRRGGKGGGYTRNTDDFNQRGKREFDRHNGTGICPEEKRGGRGAWNWGSVEEASNDLMELTPDVPVKPEEPQIPVEDENLNRAMDDEDGEMVVQVAMEMTLDEWKALQETSRPKTDFNIRKAEDKIPSKAKVIHQSKHMENFKASMEDMEEEGNFLRRSVNDITSLLDINFGSLGRPSRGGRGRAARGGRLERARPILEKEDGLVPNPDDPEDFPALATGR
uniref:Intracellular hyaluronan-binding protein 4-like n=1 Tax=Acanthochromis polyacanthus TaxID=80966 RepID=A0A3Q1FFM4_9TELE